jgi:hypothetical protein
LEPETGQNCNVKIGNRSFENVSQFKYSGTTVTNRNLIQEEIKRRLNSGGACYHSVQNLLSSTLLPENIKRETWSLILREEHRLRVLENRRGME